MSQRKKPATPSNIQALINQNELHAAAVEQAKINLSKQNETKFREEHQSFIHNAEVRRNMRRSQEEAKIALVGPTRMDYSKVIGIMEYLISQLDEVYGEDNDGE